MPASLPSEAVPAEPVPLVTVSFRNDLPLLRLQARSFARYLAVETGRRIYVVNNDNEADAFSAAFANEVIPEYGPHAHQVTLLPREACLAGFDSLKGWRRQQLLKWAMAQLLESRLYLTLDSKNILVRPWRNADLFTAEGRIRLARRRLPDKFLRSFHYFVAQGQPRPDYVSNISTPYALSVPMVREMLAEIAAREPVSPFQMLADDPTYYEYALYWSFVVARQAAAMYDLHKPPLSGGFWFDDHEKTDAVLKVLSGPHTAWVGVHRRIVRASPEAKAQIAAFLAQRGLFATVQEALDGIALLRRKL